MHASAAASVGRAVLRTTTLTSGASTARGVSA
jgi:hypothetical protein